MTVNPTYRTRELFFVRRAVDRRRRVALDSNGASRFHTTSVANVAELIRLAAEHPRAQSGDPSRRGSVGLAGDRRGARARVRARRHPRQRLGAPRSLLHLPFYGDVGEEDVRIAGSPHGTAPGSTAATSAQPPSIRVLPGRLCRRLPQRCPIAESCSASRRRKAGTSARTRSATSRSGRSAGGAVASRVSRWASATTCKASARLPAA